MGGQRVLPLLLAIGSASPSTPVPAGLAGASRPTLATVQCQLDELLRSSPAGLPETPTIVLAGHHNDGKSAILEALLGLRLAHIGASMSTRRTLRVHAQNVAECDEPEIHLTRDDGLGEERVSAADVREYVEAENVRLHRLGEVEDAPIRVRVRWRHAPTVVLVDTPGLLSLPNSGSEAAAADTALVRMSEAAERVLLDELAPATRICLCLEDTSDWQLSPTRNVVCKADPTLCRTVLVATKLDGKLAQFSMAEDLHRLLNPSWLQTKHPKLLGGPVFTSVPPTRDASSAALAEAIRKQEASMCALLAERLGSSQYAERVGVNALRSELQPLINARWGDALRAAHAALGARMAEVQRQMQAPRKEPEGESLEDFAQRFCQAIDSLIKGSIGLAAATHGETLQDEQRASESGPLCRVATPEASQRKAASDAAASSRSRASFSAGGGEVSSLAAAAASAAASDSPEELALLWVHAGKRLYGGAQYWRALQEFMLGAAQAPVDEVSIEEIVNAMGVDGYHDGVNYMRAVCVIVVEKARGYFEIAIEKLRLRMLHIMSRLSPLASELMLANGPGAAQRAQTVAALESTSVMPASPAQHAEYMNAVAPVFERFVRAVMASTMERCTHDVAAMTRYVSWDFSSPTKDALHNLLVEPVHEALQARFQAAAEAREVAKRRGRKRRRDSKGEDDDAAPPSEFASYEELFAGMTETLMTRRVSAAMHALINELVREIIRAWREEFCRAIQIKLNANFLLPFCEALPNYMRKGVRRFATDAGLVDVGVVEGESGTWRGAAEDAADARTSKLRESLVAAETQRQALHQIGEQLQQLQSEQAGGGGPVPPAANSGGGGGMKGDTEDASPSSDES